MKSCLKFIDLFGQPVEMNIGGKTKIKTGAGGIFTILLAIVVLNFVWFIGNDIFYRANPTSYLHQTILPQFPEIRINKTEYPLAISISDAYGNPIYNKSIFTLTMTQFNISINSTTQFFEMNSMTNIELKTCTTKDLPMMTEADFKNSIFPTSFCPNVEEVVLKGYWTESQMNYIIINFAICDYSNPKANCSSSEEIQKFMKSNEIGFNLLYYNNIVSVKDFLNPLVKFSDNSFKNIDLRNKKKVNIQVAKHHVLTDSAIYMESWQDTPYLEFLEYQNDILQFDENDKILVTLGLYSSKKSYINYRKYIKATEILASVGGILKVVMIFMELLVIPFARFANSTIVFNKFLPFFDDSPPKNTNLQMIQAVSSNNLQINLKSPFTHNIPSIQSNTNNQLIMQQNNLSRLNQQRPQEIAPEVLNILVNKKRQQGPIKLKHRDLLGILCYHYCKCKPSLKMIKLTEDWKTLNNSKKRGKKLFDILFISQKLIELEYFKNTILSPQHLDIIKLLSSTYNDHSEKSKLKSFQSLISAGESSDFNKNLTDMILEKRKVSFL